MMDMSTFLFFILLLIIIAGVAYTAFKFGRHYQSEVADGPKYARNGINGQLEPVMMIDSKPPGPPIAMQQDKHMSWYRTTPETGTVGSTASDPKPPKRTPLSKILKSPRPEEVRRRRDQEELRKAEAETNLAKREGGTFVK